MDRLMRKLGDEQAARKTVGVNAFFKKVAAPDERVKPSGPDSKSMEERPTSPAKEADLSAEDTVLSNESGVEPADEEASSPVGEDTQVLEETVALSPSQGVEPSGTTEVSQAKGGHETEEEEEEMAEQEREQEEEMADSDDEAATFKRLRRVRRASEESEPETKEDVEMESTQHRRLKATADQDEEEEAEEQDNGAEAKESAEKKYFQDVKVVDDGADTDDADDAPTREEDSDEELPNGDSSKVVRLEDFDDEEEFLLAGGDVHEAKKRKEWGLHHSDAEEEVVEEEGKKKKDDKAEMRKIYRESERLLREKRCMIKPVQTERLSFSGLFQKVEDKQKELQTPASQVNVSPQPVAPQDEGMADSEQSPSGLVILDDDDDEFEVVFTDQVAKKEEEQTKKEENATKIADAAKEGKEVKEAKEVKEEQGGERKREPQQAGPTPLSPVVTMKQRGDLKKMLRQSAFARSEHVSAIKPDPFLQPLGEAGGGPAGKAAHYIAAEEFEAGKPGYVFHMGARGLGYYADAGPNQNRHCDPVVEEGEGEGKEEGKEEEPASVSVVDMFNLPVTDSQEVDTNMQDTQLADDGEEKGEGGAARVLNLQYDEDETQADGGEEAAEEAKPKAKSSIFRSFFGVDAGTAAMHGAGSGGQEEEAEGTEQSRLAGPSVGPKGAGAGARRAYGRSKQLKKAEEEERVSDGDEASGEEEEEEEEVGKAKEEFSWREPTLDEEEGKEGEADDEEDEEDEDDDEDEEESEEESEEEEEEAPKEPEKKTLNDVVSIKKQSALRIGTLEAGYLRNEHEAMGISEDVGVAKEDLEEGIDLMDTDGEDNEEELDEDSEEERQVAEGFIEDAKFAVQDMDPEAYKQFHQQQQDDDEQRITDRILDVVRGESRRRKVQGGEEWIPNRNARQRVLNQMGGNLDANGFAISDQAQIPTVEDASTNEEIVAQIAAAHAKEKADRIKFQQQKKLEEARKGEEDADDAEGAGAGAGAPLMRRSTSFCGPQLSAFTRQLSFSAQAIDRSTSKSGGLKRSVSILGKRPCTSLLGAAAGGCQDGKAEKESKFSTGKNFFFDKKQRTDSDAQAGEAQASDKSDLSAVPMRRGASTAALPFTKKAGSSALPKRTTSNLIKSLDDL